ncbi:MAG: hypothetical protein NTW03_10650 [Verrucomicrobia bacterium]|nr:hypothetical protein [Verrucomicrobiota bacterium]
MKIHDLILHNLPLKLFSLLMAVLLWETIHLSASRRESGVFGSSSANTTNQFTR